jgi:hypothetical protein
MQKGSVDGSTTNNVMYGFDDTTAGTKASSSQVSSVSAYFSFENVPPICVFPYNHIDWYDEQDMANFCFCIGDNSSIFHVEDNDNNDDDGMDDAIDNHNSNLNSSHRHRQKHRSYRQERRPIRFDSSEMILRVTTVVRIVDEPLNGTDQFQTIKNVYRIRSNGDLYHENRYDSYSNNTTAPRTSDREDTTITTKTTDHPCNDNKNELISKYQRPNADNNNTYFFTSDISTI